MREEERTKRICLNTILLPLVLLVVSFVKAFFFVVVVVDVTLSRRNRR